jgi:hypothetical protein
MIAFLALIALPLAPAPWVPATVPDLPPVEWAADLAREAARQAALHPVVHQSPAAAIDTEVASQPPFFGQLHPACSGDVVTMDWGSTLQCDVSPPQRLDVRFPGATDLDLPVLRQRCDDMGGDDLVLEWVGGYLTCEGVDY